ncbi:FGGY-family carbohydrate kinase [Defluviimonas sp. WL0075]|uniref:Carbohydrate kinase n=1 Tax=Albidovulum sediminicola TaxID=2984331 RepID=A0ABT2Z2S6_9RHOB|nr:FGGY-family carbohydrate kinase [Defluviimonas sp. WL0075]MCV2865096.1 carbohydrate kinase [Defluviimonas sp. WL0075]
MQPSGRDILIGIDAGTSVIKSVAFELGGRQIGVASVPNRYTMRPDGAAFQPLGQTWADCARTLRDLAEKVPDLARRTAGIAVTAQGDGTWLVGAGNVPVTDGWLWLDARAAALVREMRSRPSDRARFEATGTGLNACQMGAQLAQMQATTPELLDRAEVSLHAKDWLYLNLTGQRVTDPCEATFTFGDFRTRRYDEAVIDTLGLTGRRALLPEIVDGTQVTHALTEAAAEETGLLAGTPVSLGYVDVACTALGAGIHTPDGGSAGCTIIGSTGMHMRARRAEDVHLNEDRTGYVMLLPMPGMVAQIQSNMAATLNIDWALQLAGDLVAEMGGTVSQSELIGRIEGWLAASTPGQILYHPYISDAGERGPFIDSAARASLVGLSIGHRFPDLIRAVIEGLGLAAHDCYAAMGEMPAEVRLTGGAARSAGLRGILSAAIGAPTRVSSREEAGAAGAAMMSAVAIGAYPDMEACIADWVVPQLGAAEAPDPVTVRTYARLYPTYRDTRLALQPVWSALSKRQDGSNG